MNYTEDISRKSLRDVQSLGPIEISPSKKIKRTSGPKITIRPTRPPVVVCVCVFFFGIIYLLGQGCGRGVARKSTYTHAHMTHVNKNLKRITLRGDSRRCAPPPPPSQPVMSAADTRRCRSFCNWLRV